MSNNEYIKQVKNIDNYYIDELNINEEVKKVSSDGLNKVLIYLLLIVF